MEGYKNVEHKNQYAISRYSLRGHVISRTVVTGLIIMMIGAVNTMATPISLGYGTHQVSESIQMNDDLAYVIHMRGGDRLEVVLRETTGKRVDFYLTNLTAYMAYKASLSGFIEFDYLYFLAESPLGDLRPNEQNVLLFAEFNP